MLFDAEAPLALDAEQHLLKIPDTIPEDAQLERVRTAGLCDLQLNGFAGVDFNNPDLVPEHFETALETLLRCGVTTVLPTVITASDEDLRRTFAALERARAQSHLAQHMVPGYHLEGPFLNPAEGFAGCHPAQHMEISADWSWFEGWQNAAGGRIRLMTVAPELPGVLPLIPRLVEAGVTVALGHCNPSHEIVRQAAEAGARLSTHLGNGVPQLLPKVDNSILSQLAEDALSASFIADGFHQRPHVLGVYLRAKQSPRTILVSDGTAASGAPAGTYRLGKTAIQSTPQGMVHLPGTQNLAGSGATLLDCLHNILNWYGTSLAEGLRWTSEQPRTLINLPSPWTVGHHAQSLTWQRMDLQWQLQSVQFGNQILNLADGNL